MSDAKPFPAHALAAENAARQDTGSPVGASRSPADNTSYSSYLFGRSGAADKPLWSDSMRGRATIRLVSRGIVGAIAMTAVDRVARAQLLNYTPESIANLESWWQANTSRKIAKAYDVAFGKPIQAAVRLLSPAEKAAATAERAVHFRPKTYYFDQPGHMPGHSLGAEIVQVTASFAAGSLGDATTRNIIQSFDPNNRKSWMVNDRGETARDGEKAHFHFGRWLNSTATTAWRVVSKNMGEDWAVALPYVYQMRWQRNLLAGSRFPNIKLCLDNSWNGGSTLIDQDGKIMGDFQLAGAVDLHARFVGYNWYTLMYRETYDAIGRQFGQWKENGFALHSHLPSNPVTASAQAVGDGARYVAKSFIKSNLYMNPAMLAFWPMRVAQSKWRSAPIVAGQAAHLNAIAQNATHAPFDNSGYLMRDAFGSLRHGYPSTQGMYRQTSEAPSLRIDGGKTVPAGLLQGDKVYSWDMAKTLVGAHTAGGLFSAAVMPLGWLSYKAGGLAARGAQHYLPQGGRIGTFLNSSGALQPAVARERFMRELVDNSLSYTPYMIAKTETALHVDERPTDGSLGAMDKAIYKLIDSTVRFRFQQSGAALKEIFAHATDMGREVKMREGGTAEPTPVAAAPEKTSERPDSTVHAATVDRAHARAAADAQEPASHAAANHSEQEQRWAENVTGRALKASFQPAHPSIH